MYVPDPGQDPKYVISTKSIYIQSLARTGRYEG